MRPNQSYTKQEQYYRQIVNLANVAIVKFDTKFILTDFTGNAEKVFGFSKSEVIGKSLYDTIVPRHETTGRDLVKLITKVVENIPSYEYNVNENIRKDGRKIWMQWYNSEIRNQNNDLTGVLSIGIDITDRINMELALKESEERFKTLSNLTFEGILIHNEGIIMDCNLSFERQIGYSREELIGMNVFDKLIPARYHKMMKGKIMQEAAQYEAEAIHRDGSVIPISIESKTSKIGSKKVRVAAIRNISELKKTIKELDRYKNQLEEIVKQRTEELKKKSRELKKQNTKLEAANTILHQRKEELESTLEQLKLAQSQLIQSEKMASLGVLLAGIAHEINNPVNFIYAGVNSMIKDFNEISNIIHECISLDHENTDMEAFLRRIEILKKEHDLETTHNAISETLQDIKLGATRIKEIVNGLSRFSRLEQIQWKPANIHDEIDSVLILLKNKYKHHIQIIKEFDSALPMVECHPGKLNQVFMNIINNAIDAIGQEQGTITLKTGVRNEWVYLSIRDSGRGIDNKQKSKIFDPFYTTKEVGHGLGLGLAISYSIIQEHRGEINVNSVINEGSEFIIKIPVKQPDIHLKQ